jgi:hypothetical protein
LRILVVPAKPEVRVGFVATLRGAVEDWLVPHQKLQPRAVVEYINHHNHLSAQHDDLQWRRPLAGGLERISQL